VGVPILGIVENMAGFVCPCCSTKTDIFAGDTGGGAKLAADTGVPFLGSLPLDPQLLRACEKGQSYLATQPDATGRAAFQNFVANVLAATPELAATAAAVKKDGDEGDDAAMTAAK
jgi:hypothetical protein